MKKVATILAVLAMMVFGSVFAAQADTVQVFTAYNVLEYVNQVPSGGGWKTVIGDPAEFSTPSATVTSADNGDVTFKTYTNYPIAGISPAGMGMLALDLDNNGSFEHGVAMTGVNAGKVYDITAWTYTKDTIFGNGSYYYGGKFNQDNPQFVPVSGTTGAMPDWTGVVAWQNALAGDPAKYLVTLFLPGVNAGGDFNNFNWVWAPPTCGNASIGGHFEATAVPIPPSVLLLGSGLLGLLGIRRKSKAGLPAE